MQDTIARVLAENLSLLIPTERVVLHPWSRRSTRITRSRWRCSSSTGPGGEVVLVARWSLLDRDGKELALRMSRLSQAAGGADYEAMVTAMGRTPKPWHRYGHDTPEYSLASPTRSPPSTIESQPSASRAEVPGERRPSQGRCRTRDVVAMSWRAHATVERPLNQEEAEQRQPYHEECSTT